MTLEGDIFCVRSLPTQHSVFHQNGVQQNDCEKHEITSKRKRISQHIKDPYHKLVNS